MMLEYVMSGTGYTRIHHSETKKGEGKDWFHHYIKKLQTEDHKFSMLFNALTETNLGKHFKEEYDNSLYAIHADSGGLQIVTGAAGGKSVSHQDIYKSQGLYSDVAMSFDEIPVLKTTEKAKINNNKLRKFDRDNIRKYATKSAENILEQLEAFQKMNSNAKAMAIIHGNDYDTYMQWADIMVERLGKEGTQGLGGVSISGAAQGTGLTERIERAFSLTQLPDEFSRKFHLLGIGSIGNLLPILCFHHAGLFKENSHISYDSTTHSSNLSRVRAMCAKTGKLIVPGRTFSREWETIYDQLIEAAPESKDYIKSGHDLYEKFEKRDKYTHLDHIIALSTFMFYSVTTFKTQVDKFLNNKDLLTKKLAHRKTMPTLIANLSSIRDVKDYKAWEGHAKRSFQTDRIVDAEVSSLEQFM